MQVKLIHCEGNLCNKRHTLLSLVAGVKDQIDDT